MVYLYNIGTAQTITLPNASATTASGTLSFDLIGEASGLSVFNAPAVVVPAWGGLYYRVTISDASAAPEGEMRYELRDGNEIVANGVARVVGWHDAPTQDGTATNIIQYE